MNIICVICTDLLQPSSDVYTTPCGHIFHFQCLTTWFERSKTCPQCRERTTPRSIHRIYFNFPNDDSSHRQSSDNLANNIRLQCEVDNLNFRLTTANQMIKNLKEVNSTFEERTKSFKEIVLSNEQIINEKNSAIDALKQQLEFYKLSVSRCDKKDKEIKALKEELENLSSIKDILNSSANEVDSIINTYSDIPKLQIFVSVLKRELENSMMQIKRLREKASVKSRTSAELSQVRSKLRQLEETLKNQKEERAVLQAKFLEIQIATCSCKCDKIPAVKEMFASKSETNFTVKLPSTTTKRTSKSPKDSNTLQSKNDNDRLITAAENVENTPRNIKSQGFFSMTNRGVKRTGSSVTVPSILAKKPANLMNFNELDEMKKKYEAGTAFDGFGGHAKYDKFPDKSQLKKKPKETEIKSCKNKKA